MTRRETVIAWTLAALATLAMALVPNAFAWLLEGDNYWLQIYIWVLFFAQCSAAWNLIGGFAGQYSIGHAAFLGIGAYVSTLLYLYAGLTPWLGMFAGGAVAASVAAAVAYPCFRLRGAFFSLVTIAFAEMLRVGLELTDTVFGMEINGVSGLLIPPKGNAPEIFQFIAKEAYAYVMLALLIATLGVCWAVKRSRLGYYLTAISDDEEAVASLGINPARVKLVALLLSAFLMAMVGTFYAQFILYITPTRTMSLDLSVQMVVTAVLGGMGTVFGPLLGAIVLVPIGELTRAFWGGSLQGVHLVIYGVLLIVVILYAPKGMEPWARAGFVWLVRRLAILFGQAPEVRAVVANRPVIELPPGQLLAPRGGGGPVRPATLTLTGVSLSFGGAVGVRDLSFEVAPGEAVGLIGPNGAGKTTVFNLVTGFLKPQAGEIRFGVDNLAGRAPEAINRLGIARTFQIVKPFTKLTALENVMVAALPRSESLGAASGEAARCLAFVGLGHRAATLADGLSTGERKRLELARALATRPRLLLLDEVTGGLDQRSLPGIIALMRKIKAEGISLLVVEHNLRVISEVADRLVMLNLGERIREGSPRAVLGDPEVIDIYVGGGAAVR